MFSKKLEIGDAASCAETYLLVRFLRRALRTQKSQNFLRRQEPHALRRSISAASFLQEAFTASAVISQRPLSTPQPSLQCGRRDPGAHLSDLSGHWQDRNYSSTETERGLPAAHRFARVSSSDYPATIPLSHGSQSLSQIKKTASTVAGHHDRKTGGAYQSHLRSRLDDSHGLWQTRTGARRLQSRQARSSLLSSFALFQWPDQRFLAGRTAFRFGLYRHRSSDFAQGFIRPVALLSKDRNYERGQGLLRSQDHRISGDATRSLCHRRQTDQALEGKATRLGLQKICFGFCDRRVSLSTTRLEKALSLRGHQTPHCRRPDRTTNALHREQTHLSSHRYRFVLAATQRVEILQRSRRRRTDYQRTERQLSLSQNPESALRCQRSLLSPAAVLIQSHQLVQKTLSAKRISPHDADNLALAPAVGAERADRLRQQTYAQAAGQLFIQRCFYVRHEEN